MAEVVQDDSVQASACRLRCVLARVWTMEVSLSKKTPMSVGLSLFKSRPLRYKTLEVSLSKKEPLSVCLSALPSRSHWQINVLVILQI